MITQFEPLYAFGFGSLFVELIILWAILEYISIKKQNEEDGGHL